MATLFSKLIDHPGCTFEHNINTVTTSFAKSFVGTKYCPVTLSGQGDDVRAANEADYLKSSFWDSLAYCCLYDKKEDLSTCLTSYYGNPIP